MVVNGVHACHKYANLQVKSEADRANSALQLDFLNVMSS